MFLGAWVARLVKGPPSAQVTIPGSRDGVPRRAPRSAGSPPLPLPLPLPPALALPLSQMNKKSNMFFPYCRQFKLHFQTQKYLILKK